MSNVFAEPTPQANPLDDLVGPGKKFATVDELAKSYSHGQNHISTLEAEAAQWREGLQSQIENQRQQAQNPNSPPSPPSEQRAEEPNLDDRIRNAIEETRQQEKLTTNVNDVSAKLVSIYGDPQKANQAMQAKAAELDMTIEDLMEQASKSPKAFYALVGLNDGARQAPAPRGNVNPAALNTLNPSQQAAAGTYAFYEQLRKENPRLYNSPKIQLQMHKEALEKGDSFFA